MPSAGRPVQEVSAAGGSGKTSNRTTLLPLAVHPVLTIIPGATKQRSKKITVACNFCRCKRVLLSRHAIVPYEYSSAEIEMRRRTSGMCAVHKEE